MLLFILGDDVFYCYYERVAERRMWFFFIRHFGAKEVASVSESFFAIRNPSSGWSRVGGDNIFGQRRISQVGKGKGKSFLQRARGTVQSWKAGNLQQGTHVDHP